jgi:PAS domain S-box-containing protein
VFPDDPERSRRAAFLDTAVLVLLVALPLMVVGNLIGQNVTAIVNVEDAVTFVVCLAVRALNRRGRVTLASAIFVAWGWAMCTVVVCTLGTVRAPATSTFLLVILVAGMLFGLRALLATVALCAATATALVWAEARGLLPRADLRTGPTQAITLAIIFAWAGVLLYVAIRDLRRAIADAERELGRRVTAERALEAHLGELERVVSDRTAALRAEIEERSRAVEAERQARRLFEQVFRTQPDGLLLTRLSDGRVMEVNDGLCRMAGAAREELMHESTVSLGIWAEPDGREKVMAQMRAAGSVEGVEAILRRASGEIFTALYSGSVIELAGETCVLSVVRDIGDRKRLESEREALIAELQATLAEVKTLTGIIPICMHCKAVRDDQGFWGRVEAYVQSHTHARFTHGLCPDCLDKHYPEE